MPQRIRKRVSKRTGDVTWAVQLPTGTRPDGSTAYIYKSFKRQRDAKEFADKVGQDLGKGLPAEPAKMTLDQYLDQWLANLRSTKSVRANTLEGYEELMRIYVRPHLGQRLLGELTPLAIQNLVTKLGEPRMVKKKLTKEQREAGESDVEERLLAPRTIRLALSVLSKALRQGVRLRLLAHNPADGVELPRRVRREMSALSSEQGRAFLSAAEGSRFEALFKLAVATGMRPSEYLALRWSDVDLDRGQVTVHRSLVRTKAGSSFADTKTDRSRRALALPTPVVDALRAHRIAQAEERLKLGAAWEQPDLIFTNEIGGPVDHKNLLRRHFRPLLKKAGLPPTVRLYDLRHTCATLMLAANVHPKVAADVLGHSSIRTTMDTYSHVLEDMKGDAAKKVGDLLFSEG